LVGDVVHERMETVVAKMLTKIDEFI